MTPITLGSSALKFNAVAEWWDEYIAYVSFSFLCPARSRVDIASYDVLKRHIYRLEKEHHRLSQSHVDIEANERTGLVESDLDGVFVPLLDQELHKISAFYEQKEMELFEALHTLEDLVTEQDEAGLETWERYMDDYADEEDDEDDEEDQMSDHVHFEDEQRAKRRRRKSSSVSYRPRSGSGTSCVCVCRGFRFFLMHHKVHG